MPHPLATDDLDSMHEIQGVESTQQLWPCTSQDAQPGPPALDALAALPRAPSLENEWRDEWDVVSTFLI